MSMSIGKDWRATKNLQSDVSEPQDDAENFPGPTKNEFTRLDGTNKKCCSTYVRGVELSTKQKRRKEQDADELDAMARAHGQRIMNLFGQSQRQSNVYQMKGQRHIGREKQLQEDFRGGEPSSVLCM